MPRRAIPKAVRVEVLTECGYRCAVPTCRNILAIDIHHIVQVAKGGGNSPGNLLALCPTCHALYHRGEIPQDSIYAWKSVLVSLSQAFDVPTIDNLLFLGTNEAAGLRLSGDGVLYFARLIGSGLATFEQVGSEWEHRFYHVSLTQR